MSFCFGKTWFLNSYYCLHLLYIHVSVCQLIKMEVWCHVTTLLARDEWVENKEWLHFFCMSILN